MPSQITRPAVFLVCLALAAIAATASAQDTPPAPQPAAQSTMQVTQVKNGWLVAPDVKLTQVDDRTATFLGAYGGYVTEGALLVGGGGYWLANNSSDFKMGYGGLVVEWLARTDKRIGFGARGLVGGGTATLGISYADVYGPWAPVTIAGGPVRFGHHHDGWRPSGPGFDPGSLANQKFLASENFFVFEPQANLLVSFTDWMRLNAGVGYRVIGGTSVLEDRLGGIAGTIAVQFGGGS